MQAAEISGKKALRHEFLTWQCLLRQDAMRRLEGRPGPAMGARVVLGEEEVFDRLIMLIMPRQPEAMTAQFRFHVQRSPDPRKVHEDAVRLLQAEYFQYPRTFTDRLTAMAPEGSPGAAKLVAAGACTLVFSQAGRTWEFTAKVKALKPAHRFFQHTLWHNRQFNRAIPDNVTVLAFKPKWKTAKVYYSPGDGE